MIFTLLQTVSIISRNAGHRVACYLDQLIPRLNAFCQVRNTDSGSQSHDQLLELWENCLQAFCSVLTRCPRDMDLYNVAVLDTAMEFLLYDPNYVYPELTEDEQKNNAPNANEGDAMDWVAHLPCLILYVLFMV